MKKIALAAVLGALFATTSAQAQTLQPQMSAQDVAAGMEVHGSHVIVPIFTILLLIAAGSSSYSPK